MRSSASSLKFQYLLFSWRSSINCSSLRIFPHLPIPLSFLIQSVYKWMAQFQKLTRNLFLTLRAQRTPSAAATVQVSHALPAVRFSRLLRGQFPRWRRSKERLSLCSFLRCPDLWLQCTKPTLHSNHRSGHLKTEQTESLSLLRRHLGNWSRGPVVSMRSELLVAHEKLWQLPLLTVYVVPV